MTIDFEDTIPDEKSNVLPMVQPEKRRPGRPKGSGNLYGSAKAALKHSPEESEYRALNEREIAAILAERFNFRYDVCTNSIEYIDSDDKDCVYGGNFRFLPAKDEVEYRTYAFARTHQKAAEYSDLRAQNLIRQALRCWSDEQRYNPVVDYLYGCLEKFEARLAENGDHYNPAQYFLSCFQEREGHSNASAFIWKWLLGCVNQAMYTQNWYMKKDECKFINHQNPMLIFAGKQGLGKTFLAEWLCLGLGWKGNLLRSEDPIMPTDKDDKINLSTTWIWCADEFLSTINRAEQSALKSFLTKKESFVRHPYGKHKEYRPRLCNFIGTVNEDEFLTDTTGNRRYLTVYLENINKSYSEYITPDELWGQVMYQYVHGENARYQGLPASPVLSASEAAARDAVNESARMTDPLEEYLSEWIEPTGSTVCNIASRDIWHKLVQTLGLRNDDQKRYEMKIMTAMRVLGFVKDKGMVMCDDGTKRNAAYYMHARWKKEHRPRPM